MSFTSNVSSGTTVTGETVVYGTQTVYFSGTAESATLDSNGYQIVSSGGTADYTTISSGGVQLVSSNGTVDYTSVSSGGTLMVYSGGRAFGFNIISGGAFGYDFNTIISGTSNGVEIVSSSGKSSYNLHLYGGITQNVSSGYTADSAAVDLYASQIVSSGGVANYTRLNLGSITSLSGIYSGGNQIIFSGGVANYTKVRGCFGGAAVTGRSKCTTSGHLKVHHPLTLIYWWSKAFSNPFNDSSFSRLFRR